MARRREYIAYKITCIPNARIYIGITSYPLADRWRGHVYLSRSIRKGPRSTAPLGQAIREHGPEAFTIEHIASAYSWKDLLATEQQLIAQWGSMLPAGFNATLGGLGGTGRRQSDDERAMRSLAAFEKMKDPDVRAGYSQRLARINKERPPRTRCKHGHSLDDAYQNGGNARVCRVCTDAKRRRSRERARALGEKGSSTDAIAVVFQGVLYPSVNAVARTLGKTLSWSRRRFASGAIQRYENSSIS